ncbi:MAG: hypothetical protein WHT64_08445 [Desulfomicrobiaceae bacterium]
MTISVHEIRAAISAVPFENDQREAPRAEILYLPRAHRKALGRESVLVVGARGVGKSFWTAALRDEQLRSLIGRQEPALAQTRIAVGYAATPNNKDFPDKDILASLLDKGFKPYAIWRAVIFCHLARWLGENAIPETWVERVRYVVDNPEGVACVAETADRQFLENGQYGLILFDALDRVSDDWQSMDQIVSALLRASLWVRGFKRLRTKVFVRPDQIEREVTAFPDASKLLATRVGLTWERHDLHAMLWQRLINVPGEDGEALRAIVRTLLPNGLNFHAENGVWRLPVELQTETALRRLFEKLAGDKMGKDARRGVPYVWSVSHLADGHGQTSPRSFLAAIKSAADDSLARYPDHPLALHYESIKRGIQSASRIRVDEIAEDYPWIRDVLAPLRGQSVPCEFANILNLWSERYPDGPGMLSGQGMLPAHAEQGWEGVREDLQRIGVFTMRQDGRIDMPDLYRVGFGLGRRGGVKPNR